ncbi:hypothetical protein EFL26_22175 [Nocardioides pocheonensis]|uniref:Uncharacterized protein n=1 Tax=Nocardioides pocheonensis TaxID=661485 RepID=A0A3N0GIA6_9ACTN|nr:hypothetical protein EFL26_22175 [Nocardioides pocheonensis]
MMPLVEVTVATDGYLAVTLDREPYSADSALQRGDLQRLVDGIVSDLGTPVRVEVHEADGSTFTDIVTPELRPADPPTKQVQHKALASAFGISGGGFLAGETVEVCVVVARRVADDEGLAQLRLPPAVLADHPHVVLIGRTSGAFAVSQGSA